MFYFMSIKNDRVEITKGHRDASPYIVKSADDFYGYMAAEAKRLGIAVEDLRVTASSTMDFPEEWTDDPKVIAMARELRGVAAALKNL